MPHPDPPETSGPAVPHGHPPPPHVPYGPHAPYGQQAPPQAPYGSGSGAEPPRGERRGRRVFGTILAVVGSLLLVGGGGITAKTFANAQQEIPNRTAYGREMWREVPAGRLFPRVLGPKPRGSGGDEDALPAWNRAGIAGGTDCAAGLDGAPAAEAAGRGCEAVLRATYTDPTGNFVATVALVVLQGPGDPAEGMRAFFDAERDAEGAGHGVRAFAVPDTVAAGWEDGERNGTDGMAAGGTALPYAVVASAGSVDGRRAGRLPAPWGRRAKDAEDDRGPWRQAALDLSQDLDRHLSNLLVEETS